MTGRAGGRPLRVLYVSAEMSPFSKVGGLADVAASLPKALAALGHDVRVITPDHGDRAPKAPDAPSWQTNLRYLGQEERVTVLQSSLGSSVPFYLVGNDRYFRRSQVYGEPDDLLRYQLFCLAALEATRLAGWQPDILHCNDWHTAFLPFALRNRAWSEPWYRPTASVLTIHNLRYRGPDELTDILSQGIYYADLVSTVSQTYAREITTPELGEGLDSLLRLRQDRLFGIVNGLDTELFDPSTDPALAAHYDSERLHLKLKNKEALQARVGLAPNAAAPLAGVVSRLVEQKGIDLLAAVLERAVVELGLQCVVLGAGDPVLQQQLLQQEARRPAAVKVVSGFEPELAQLIYGGADLFLMPSRYEPCGLGQLIAMRYGTVPVARRTGGLADTVADASADLAQGTGFVFEDYTPGAFLQALGRAVAAFRQRDAWATLQRRCMAQDFSWAASARSYEAMYYQAQALGARD
ncbi:MAG: glycogen synthase [Chloroflexi bacterium]|nr:glycogen synthase [Chloroflexota bacterium]